MKIDNTKSLNILEIKAKQLIEKSTHVILLCSQLSEEVMKLSLKIKDSSIENNEINKSIKTSKEIISKLLSLKQAPTVMTTINMYKTNQNKDVTAYEITHRNGAPTSRLEERSKKINSQEININYDDIYFNGHSNIMHQSHIQENNIRKSNTLIVDYDNYNQNKLIEKKSHDNDNNNNNNNKKDHQAYNSINYFYLDKTFKTKKITKSKNLKNQSKSIKIKQYKKNGNNNEDLKSRPLYKNNKIYNFKANYVSLYDSDLSLQDELPGTSNDQNKEQCRVIMNLLNDEEQNTNNAILNKHTKMNGKPSSEKSKKTGIISNDLVIKHAFQNLSNKSDAVFMEDATNNLARSRSNKRKNQLDEVEEKAMREYMKSKPELENKKNLTQNMISKLRLLMRNEKRQTELQSELNIDKQPLLFKQPHWESDSYLKAPLPTSPFGTPSHNNTSIFEFNNDSIYSQNYQSPKVNSSNSLLNFLDKSNERRRASSTKCSEEADISTATIENKSSQLNINDEDDIILLQNQKSSKKLKQSNSLTTTTTPDHLKVKKDQINMEINEKLALINTLKQEHHKVIIIHEKDMQATIEIQEKQLQQYRNKAISEKMPDNCIAIEISNLTKRQAQSREKQAADNNLISETMLLKILNEEETLRMLEMQLLEYNNKINQAKSTDKCPLTSTAIKSKETDQRKEILQALTDNDGTYKPLFNSNKNENNGDNGNKQQVSEMEVSISSTETNNKNPNEKTTDSDESNKLSQPNDKAIEKLVINQTDQANITQIQKDINLHPSTEHEKQQTGDETTKQTSKEDKIPDEIKPADEKDKNQNTIPSKTFNFTNRNWCFTSGGLTTNLEDEINKELKLKQSIRERNNKIDEKIRNQLEELKKPPEERNLFILPPNTSEDWYDLNYIRPSYDVYIIGEGLKNYTSDIHVRHAEISRCTGIDQDNIITSSQRIDCRNNSIYYKVAVGNLFDFAKLLLPWPDNAFKYGIKSLRAPIEFLKPTILDVDKKHDFRSEKATSTLINAEKYWSITNISRSQYVDTKTLIEVILNKLNCRFTKLSLLSKAMKKKIQLDLTSTSHCVTLGPLKLINLCSKCGLGHSEKSCKEANCFRCQGTDHMAINCTNKLKCVNCGGPHLCTSDLCVHLVRKSIEENWFIVNFELNEGIISHPVQLFKTRLSAEELDNYCTEKSDSQQIMVDQLREQVLETIKPVFAEQNQNINNFKTKIQDQLSQYDKKFDKIDDFILNHTKKLDEYIERNDKSLANINSTLSTNNNVLAEIKTLLLEKKN
jgi:hypothetical protein